MSRAARFALGLAAAAALAALASGPGYRLQLWSLRAAFSILTVAAVGAAVAGAAAVVAAVRTRWRARRRGFGHALVALLIAIPTFAWPAMWFVRARSLPPIHDVTTDTVDPPRFVVALAARSGAANAVDYGGSAVAAAQRKAYPDIVPLDSPLPAPDLYDRALATVRGMGWTLLADDRAQGRIEASDTTLFFGFTDDIVIRVVAHGNGSRLDVRSLSRIGKSDVGTNARRIRTFLERLKSASTP